MASLLLPLQFLSAAALALLSSASSAPGDAGDASALVQVEVLIADVAKHSRQRRGPEKYWAQNELAPVAPMQLHATQQSVRIAEAQGTSFDMDLRFNFSAANAPLADPVKVDKILHTLRNYTRTALDFSRTATNVTRQINASGVQGFDEVKTTLCDALGALCDKAHRLEKDFLRSLNSSLEAQPQPMQDMTLQQLHTAKKQMREFIAPFVLMREVLTAAHDKGEVCSAMNSQLVDLKKHARVLVALNRNQAVGSAAMLEKMPDSWKPWVNVSLVKEMGGMAAQTATSVENAARRVSDTMAGVMRERLDCTSGAAARLLRAALASALLVIGLARL